MIWNICVVESHMNNIFHEGIHYHKRPRGIHKQDSNLTMTDEISFTRSIIAMIFDKDPDQVITIRIYPCLLGRKPCQYFSFLEDIFKCRGPVSHKKHKVKMKNLLNNPSRKRTINHEDKISCFGSSSAFLSSSVSSYCPLFFPVLKWRLYPSIAP